MSYYERKQCPFAFNNSAGIHNMRCLEESCMAWFPGWSDTPNSGYCKLIARVVGE